jgi:hypothetical protein
MNKARLFDALYGADPGPDAETLRTALRRLVFSEDGLVLIKMLSPCLRPVYRSKECHVPGFAEGRRSVLWDIIRIATNDRPPESAS